MGASHQTRYDHQLTAHANTPQTPHWTTANAGAATAVRPAPAVGGAARGASGKPASPKKLRPAWSGCRDSCRSTTARARPAGAPGGADDRCSRQCHPGWTAGSCVFQVCLAVVEQGRPRRARPPTGRGSRSTRRGNSVLWVASCAASTSRYCIRPIHQERDGVPSPARPDPQSPRPPGHDQERREHSGRPGRFLSARERRDAVSQFVSPS